MTHTFHANKIINVNPKHNGSVVYADDSCLRVATTHSHTSYAGLSFFFFLFGFLPLIFFLITEQVVEPFSLGFTVFGILTLVAAIIFIPYRSEFLIFSRLSGELYYAKSQDNIIRLKWKEATGEFGKRYTFLGGGVMVQDYLCIKGTSDYPQTSTKQTSIELNILNFDDSSESWAYFQHYMENGCAGLQQPSVHHITNNFFADAKLQTRYWLWMNPKSDIEFMYESEFPLIVRLYDICFFPIMLLGSLLIFWPFAVGNAFINSTRKDPVLPPEMAQYITNDPDCWGKPEEDTKA